jgi:hypothetical protein
MVALGIKEHDKHHLFTAQCAPEFSAVDVFSGGGWLDVNTTYTYSIIHQKCLMDYNRTPVLPYLLIESTYEGEHNASEAQIRRQAYWAILCGGFGHVFGNWPIWGFGWRAPLGHHRRLGTDWKASLDSPGATSMMHWGNLFRSRAWHELVPDQKHEVVTGGLGEFRGLDYLGVARTADGSTFIAYMPTSRKITIDMSRISGSKAKAFWFDPRIGKTTNAGEFPTKGTREFIPPGEGDWALVLDDTSKGLPPPGLGKT